LFAGSVPRADRRAQRRIKTSTLRADSAGIIAYLVVKVAGDVMGGEERGWP